MGFWPSISGELGGKGASKSKSGEQDGHVIWDNLSSRLIPVTRCPMYHVHQWDIETKSFRCRLYLKNNQKYQNIWNHCWQPPVSEALQHSLSVVGLPSFFFGGGVVFVRPLVRCEISQTSTQTNQQTNHHAPEFHPFFVRSTSGVPVTNGSEKTRPTLSS